MKVNDWKLLMSCVEDGVAYGWRRAHKHVENPEPMVIQETIIAAVMDAIGEYYEFPMPEDKLS